LRICGSELLSPAGILVVGLHSPYVVLCQQQKTLSDYFDCLTSFPAPCQLAWQEPKVEQLTRAAHPLYLRLPLSPPEAAKAGDGGQSGKAAS